MSENGKKALEEYRKNLTPEQKKANIEKAKETKKKNFEEKKNMEKALNIALSKKYKWKNEKGQIQYGDGFEAAAARLVNIAHGRAGKPADSINAFKEISKFTDKEVAQANEITINFGNNQGIDI